MVAIARPSPTLNTTASEGPSSAVELYSQNCSRCHGKDGKAKGLKAKAVGARNLTDGQWQDRVSDERIFNSISNGKGKMPAYGKKLSEAEVDSLVTYVRSLKK
jgi:cbb3-type cytochrome c oxidase subunit III